MSQELRLRAGDADREAVAEVLRDAHAEGRLRLDELEDRLEAAFAAVHLDELPPLTADLPAAHRWGPADAGPASLPLGITTAYGPPAARGPWQPWSDTRPRSTAPRTTWPGSYRRPPLTPGWRGPGLPLGPTLLVALVVGLVLLAVSGAAWPLLWLVVAAVLLRGGPHRWAAHGWCGGSRQGDRS